MIILQLFLEDLNSISCDYQDSNSRSYVNAYERYRAQGSKIAKCIFI